MGVAICPLVDDVTNRLVDSPVHRNEEGLGLQDALDVVEDVVFHQEGAEQRLLRLLVVGQRTIPGLAVGLEVTEIGLCHWARGSFIRRSMARNHSRSGSVREKIAGDRLWESGVQLCARSQSTM